MNVAHVEFKLFNPILHGEVLSAGLFLADSDACHQCNVILAIASQITFMAYILVSINARMCLS